MIDFAYTAKRISGEATSGVISADSVVHARELLRGEGLFPLSVDSRSKAPAVKTQKRRGGKRVRQADLLMFTSQLSIMSRSGVDLADALKGAAEECANPVLQETLEKVYEDVAGGETVSAALAKHSRVFGDTYIVAIQAAEASGQMTEVLDRLTKLLRFEIKLQNTIRGIMTYPLILFSVALMVSTALVLFVLPQFAKVFEDLDKPVPPTTQMLLDVSVFVRSYFIYLIPLTVVLGVAGWRSLKSDAVRLLFDRLILHIKGFGPAIQSLSAGRTFTLMGTMLQSGIPLLDALGLCRTASRNRLLQNLFARLEDDVVNGRGISAGLATADCIPSGASQMIATAERSGRLAEVVQTVGEFYEEEGERQVRTAVKFLEPAIILSMGVFVSFIVMSVMLPLLDVSTVN
ncbi:MAG: type II secretion system inner membrane protein GspF [Fuerstiella sp.]